jgi:hypothetical protein
MTRDQAIERIRRLSRMTTENGCTEAEALTASAKLHAMMQEYNVGLSELDIKAAAALGCVADTFASIGATLDDWFRACSPIGKLFEVKHYFKHETEELAPGVEVRLNIVTFFGLPVDVAASVAMAQIVANAVSHEAVAWGKATKTRAAAKLTSFRVGMIDRLIERIEELGRAPKPQGYGLVIVKAGLVTEQWAAYCRAHDLRFGHARFGGAGQRVDPGAYGAGRARADGVRLGHHGEVSGQRSIRG